MVSGSINAVCLVGDYTETITHMTGTTTKVGEYAAEGRWTLMLYNVSKIGAFCCGAMLSGSYLGSESFQGGYRYSHVLIAIAVLIYLAIFLAHEAYNDDQSTPVQDGRDYGSGLLLIALASGTLVLSCVLT